MSPAPIPITVFTGFLGAGKTSVILSLLPQLPKDYKVVLLKNEFGDVEVDSKLAQQSSLTAVSEILNGCMCCVLVGQMQTAILEIREKYRPDRIIIECSGSAFPATLAFQIREIERDTHGDLKLDAIITVVDAENFSGYEDTSPTAKMQSSYTDIILINKWEHVSERALDFVLDHLNTLNDLTPKIRCRGRNGVDPNLIFGLETTLFIDKANYLHADTEGLASHNEEVETLTLYRGSPRGRPHHNHDGHCEECIGHAETDGRDHAPERSEVEANEGVSREDLDSALKSVSKESVWRVKGFVRLEKEKMHILNWAFGRYELTPFSDDAETEEMVRFTVMGERGEVRRAIRKFCTRLGATIV
ncbi:COBW domain-containing protein C15D4.05 [Hypsizygus marmoreus]|uniref:COBW domain-containing protein C15D4.05 n=1 Tax=Hypsizygus marmoreus TaxID=39966 RepID=A0A369KH38_HYPMA|nr:COBW domain-containing protein C15D4.05 [Hypsizygus marmoreus]